MFKVIRNKVKVIKLFKVIQKKGKVTKMKAKVCAGSGRYWSCIKGKGPQLSE